jgi:fibronectin type 3 domain-containing protein
MYNSDMASRNYRKALYQAKQELAHELVERQKSDQKVARLQALITQLQDLCAEQDQKRFWNGIERVVKANLKGGITQTIRVLLKEKVLPMTAVELKARIEAQKYDLTRFQNPLAVIHTVLNRLVKSGEVKVIPQQYGKKAYQWVSTTERLLSELQETIQPATQRRGGTKESR